MDPEIKRNKIVIVIRWLCALAALILVYFTGNKLLLDDHDVVISWSIMLVIAGLSFLPLASLIFRRFHDGGWLFSKTIGIAVAGWLTWYLSSVFMPFNRGNCIVILVLCAVINYTALFVYKLVIKKESINLSVFNEKKLFSAVTTEILFLACFTLWCYFRGFKPEAYGTEKFMDYAFMTTMMRTESMPPEDMWLSGNYINYYYMGQYLAVYMTKLIGNTAEYGYNLTLMTLAAFSITLPYALVYNVVKNADFNSAKRIVSRFTNDMAGKRNTLINRFMSSGLYSFWGLLAGCAVTLTSSMHYPVYKHILPYIGRIKGETIDDSYWFPDPTRYIGYNPETNDKTIHEFPSYSFVLGDLHAHVLNIMFVITFLGILYAFLLYRRDNMNKVRNGAADVKIDFVRELFHPGIIMIGFLIGLFNTTNFWDFPIYFVVAGAVILFSNAVIFNFKKNAVIMTALHAVIILVISRLVCLPFTLSFDSMANGILLTENRTMIHQLVVLWGLPIFCVLTFTISHYNKLRNDKKIIYKNDSNKKSRKNRKSNKIISIEEEKSEYKNPVFQFIMELNISDLFMIILGLCAIGLVLIPELIYVRDIYSSGYLRANTMFKLTYQAYIMFGISMGYMIPKLIMFMNKKKYAFMGIIMLICLVWTMGYIREAFKDWYGDVTDTSGYKGLNAAAFMETESEADYKAAKWLNANVEGLPVVLEANGDSYTFYQRISVITGLPTVLGWRTHEWLWRSGSVSSGVPLVVSEREEDIKTIYTSEDRDNVISLLKKYDVEYVYIGGCEREKFEQLNEELLKSLGEIAYGDPNEINAAYIIKLDSIY